MVGFPLLLIPLAIYNIIVFLMPEVSFADPIVKLKLMSGADWPVTLSDILLALAALMLLLEVIKGARPGAKYLTDHLLSLIVTAAAAAEFVLWPRFGTSTYFLLALLSLVDFLTGIALRARRRPVMAQAPVVPRESTETAQPLAEPKFEPPPAPVPAPASPSESLPAAISVAESVLLDHPGPSLARQQPNLGQPEVAPAAPAPAASSPEVPSPDLQPGNAETAPPETPPR
ncbi:MAG: hypothetical protein KGK16_03800 [Bradyrhizobium sp.]|nr:hypothetical protein [Bradyrhizobium sp.]